MGALDMISKNSRRRLALSAVTSAAWLLSPGGARAGGLNDVDVTLTVSEAEALECLIQYNSAPWSTVPGVKVIGNLVVAADLNTQAGLIVNSMMRAKQCNGLMVAGHGRWGKLLSTTPSLDDLIGSQFNDNLCQLVAQEAKQYPFVMVDVCQAGKPRMFASSAAQLIAKLSGKPVIATPHFPGEWYGAPNVMHVVERPVSFAALPGTPAARNPWVAFYKDGRTKQCNPPAVAGLVGAAPLKPPPGGKWTIAAKASSCLGAVQRVTSFPAHAAPVMDQAWQSCTYHLDQIDPSLGSAARWTATGVSLYGLAKAGAGVVAECGGLSNTAVFAGAAVKPYALGGAYATAAAGGYCAGRAIDYVTGNRVGPGIATAGWAIWEAPQAPFRWWYGQPCFPNTSEAASMTYEGCPGWSWGL